MENKLRFKHVLKRVNNTENKKWFHYEKHWKLQEFLNKKWSDVPDVYFVECEDGSIKKISYEEYMSLIKK